MEREDGHVYVKYDFGEDIATVLRLIAENIVNGRIRFDGIEQRTDGVYWTKDCGEYVIETEMPVMADQALVLDVDGRHAIAVTLRKKK